MYTVWKDRWISSAHNLREYKGKCENLHGHNWRVRVVVAGDALDKTGLLVDFADLDAAMEDVCRRYDHIYFNETPPFDEVNPSAENIARFFHDEIAARLEPGAGGRFRVHEVFVWDSEGCCASYRRSG
jgi:6-pyruvoyltetrahydropterin/6-carboxytetrahydropterin synthase